MSDRATMPNLDADLTRESEDDVALPSPPASLPNGALAGLCPYCNGTGIKLRDSAVGKAVQAYRKERGVTAKAVAEYLGFSPQYVCDLETGRRRWTVDLHRAYLTEVDRIVRDREAE